MAAGRTERELQVTLEAAFLRNGGDFLASASGCRRRRPWRHSASASTRTASRSSSGG